ncbi:MAG: hypothetical protein ACOCSE_01630 [Chitinivibrionales bacterium]
MANEPAPYTPSGSPERVKRDRPFHFDGNAIREFGMGSESRKVGKGQTLPYGLGWVGSVGGGTPGS